MVPYLVFQKADKHTCSTLKLQIGAFAYLKGDLAENPYDPITYFCGQIKDPMKIPFLG